jgi:hypothetical protein
MNPCKPIHIENVSKTLTPFPLRAAAPHENVASMLALIGLFSSVGQVSLQFISALSSSFARSEGKLVTEICLNPKSYP